MEGLADMLKAATGETRKEVLDNLVASIVDDAIKDAAADIFRTRLSQEDIAGSYSGVLRFEDIEINPDELKSKAKSSGDDECLNFEFTPEMMKQIEALKGKEQPCTMHVRPLNDASGTLTISSQGQSSKQAMKYAYGDDGLVTIDARQKGQTVVFTGRFAKNESGKVTFVGSASSTAPGVKVVVGVTVSK
jgi:hypothetical protein